MALLGEWINDTTVIMIGIFFSRKKFYRILNIILELSTIAVIIYYASRYLEGFRLFSKI